MNKFACVLMVMWIVPLLGRANSQELNSEPDSQNQGYSGWLIPNTEGTDLVLYIEGVGVFGSEYFAAEFRELLESENLTIDDELNDDCILAGYQANTAAMEIPPIPEDPTQPPGPSGIGNRQLRLLVVQVVRGREISQVGAASLCIQILSMVPRRDRIGLGTTNTVINGIVSQMVGGNLRMGK